MSYCVHCGVKLGDDLTVCPLCGTPVLDPAAPESGHAESFFATRPTRIEPVSKREAAIFISVMLASVAASCGIVDLVLPTRAKGWSLYVFGAALMVWLWFVPPLLARRMPIWSRCLLNMTAVALYLLVIAFHLDGLDWYENLALPVVVLSTVLQIILSFALQKRSTLSTMTILLSAVGVYVLGLELAGDLYIHGMWEPGWSVVAAAVCAGLSFPLIIVRRVPSLREEVRRRFHW